MVKNLKIRHILIFMEANHIRNRNCTIFRELFKASSRSILKNRVNKKHQIFQNTK